MTEPHEGMEGTRRGSLILYAAAFVVMVCAGLFLALATRSFLDDVSLLWISTGLSAIALSLAIAAFVVPRRR